VEIKGSARFCEAPIPVLGGPDTLDDRQERPEATFALQECKYPASMAVQGFSQRREYRSAEGLPALLAFTELLNHLSPPENSGP